MGNGRLFSTPTNDQMIFGQEMVSMLSVTLIAVILHWTMTSFKKDYSLTASRSMRIPCLISIISFLVMNIVGMIGWNNVFIPITSITCKIIYPFCLFSYNFGKISMYWLFTFRIELIFRHTAYEISQIMLNIYRIFCFLIPSILWSIWIYLSWNDIKPHDTDTTNPQYQYCFPQKFKYNNVYLSENIAFCIAFSDLLFSFVPLFLFVFKYYQVTKLYRKAQIITNLNKNANANANANANTNILNNNLTNNLNNNGGDLYHALTLNNSLTNNLDDNKHIGIIRKSTMLVIIAIISTWIYIFGQAYILRQLGFYLPFDGVINSLCMACLFQFGDDFYSVTFAKLECCLSLCFGQYCNICPCSCCCSDLKINDSDNNNNNNSNNNNNNNNNDNNNNNNDTNINTNSSNNTPNNNIQYYAKIQSHNNANENNLEAPYTTNTKHIPIIKANNANQKLLHQKNISSLEASTFNTQINIQTPTQRYQGSPEHNLLFSGPQSITEFVPFNLNNESPDSTKDNQKQEFSQTNDSVLTDTTSNNIKPLKPANKTGSIPVIKKYTKPKKMGGF